MHAVARRGSPYCPETCCSVPHGSTSSCVGVQKTYIWTDSDHARMRRSTSATAMTAGNHLFIFSSTTQAVVALNSGGSEFYAIVKATSLAMGAQATARDLGVPRLCQESVTWPQMELSSRTVAVQAVYGTYTRHSSGHSARSRRAELCHEMSMASRRVADAEMKHVDGRKMWRLLADASTVNMAGRSELAMRAGEETSCSQKVQCEVTCLGRELQRLV